MINDAYVTALSGRRGPVLIDCPKDVLASKTVNPGFLSKPIIPRPNIEPVSDEDINKLLDVLMNDVNCNHKPVLLVGGGARDAWKEIREFSETLSIPAACTMMGLGVVPMGQPGEHTTGLGMVGMHGLEGYVYTCTL